MLLQRMLRGAEETEAVTDIVPMYITSFLIFEVLHRVRNPNMNIRSPSMTKVQENRQLRTHQGGNFLALRSLFPVCPHSTPVE